MNTERNIPVSESFPCDISDDFGKVIKIEYQCPGVWYVANDGNGFVAGEYYIVERNTTSISKTVKEYGIILPNHPELLAFRADEPERGRDALLYEIAMYRQENGLPSKDGVSVLDAAIFGMENDPEYFGSYPAPIHTPHGTLTRYKSIVNGVIALETNEGERMIAVCYRACVQFLCAAGNLPHKGMDSADFSLFSLETGSCGRLALVFIHLFLLDLGYNTDFCCFRL